MFLTCRIARKHETTGIKFTKFNRPKISKHFRPAGATRCTDSCEIWHGRRARGSAWPIEISHQSVHAALKSRKFPFFDKDSPRGNAAVSIFTAGANPLTDIRKC